MSCYALRSKSTESRALVIHMTKISIPGIAKIDN